MATPNPVRIIPSTSGNLRAGGEYVIRDEFTTDRAAGAVNGTAAEPGPGTRVAKDTNSKLTIASGALTFATGGAAAGDPGVWLNLVARVAGQVLVAEITPANVDGSAGVGWDTNQSGAINDALRLAASGALSLVSNGGTAFTVGTYTAVSIKVAAVQRATGVFWFVYQDGKWIILYRTEAGTANVYPAINAIGTTSIFTSSYFRVPLARWLPTPLVSDGFGSTFGTSDGFGNAEGIAGGIGAGGSGVVWSNAGATWSVAAGKAINTPTVSAELVTNGNMETGDPPTGWSGASVTLDGVADERPGGSGLQSIEVTAAGAYVSASRAITVAEGTWIKATGYINPVGAVSAAIFVGASTGESSYDKITIQKTTNGWSQELKGTLRIRTGTTNAYLYLDANGTTARFDDVSVKALTLTELLSVSNLACYDVLAGAGIVAQSELQVGLALNWDSSTVPANGVIVHLNRCSGGNFIQVIKRVAGVWSSVSSTAFTYSAGARLVVAKNGTEYRTYYNNALVVANTITDAGIITNTYHGLFSTDPSNTFDDLTIYATGSSGEYNALNAF